MNIERIYEDNNIQVSFAENTDSEFCFVAFSGMGTKDAHGEFFGEPKIEFVKTAWAFGHAAFVIDKNKSWGEAIDEEVLRDVLFSVAGDRRFVTMGGSMGGFNALSQASALDAEVVIAFTPQFSVAPEFVKDNSSAVVMNASKYNQGYMKYPNMNVVDTGAREYIVHGNTEKENKVSSRFATQPNRRRFSINSGHNPGYVFKSNDLLVPFIKDCLDDNVNVLCYSRIGMKSLV